MTAIDSHCHLHDSEFFGDNREEIYATTIQSNVAMICVGTNIRSSKEAVEFCATHDKCYAVVGVHPHDAKTADIAQLRLLVEQNRQQIVGIGEIGLDYYYTHSPRSTQQNILRQQLQLAREFNLPVSFHIRDGFEDFWPIYDEFLDVPGVMHSFTDTQANLDEGFRRGLYVGINGISTFTKDQGQQQLYVQVPLEKMLIETDAPYLTPKPFRGKMNIPAYVVEIARHQAMLKGVPLEDVIRITTDNARRLFNLPL
ncbi:TatD family deoxyribonuclease [Candidatus Saccharibacteria bacterium]|nr:TatD family deoxyribonuclease [Candidatus Saccharibacteria bacterium]